MENSTEQVFLVVNNENSLEKVNAIVTATSEVNLQNLEDFSNVCRTCATITEFVIPIFEGEGQQNNLADKIHKHLPIQVTEQDELPRVVCYQCASTLLAWHELVQCCVQADSALKTRVAEQKQTAPDEDEKEQILEKDQQIKLKEIADFVVETMAPPQYAKNSTSPKVEPLQACNYCGAEHPTNALKEHLIATHLDLLFHCDECDTYVERKDFILHMSYHAVQYANHDKKTECTKRGIKAKERTDDKTDEIPHEVTPPQTPTEQDRIETDTNSNKSINGNTINEAQNEFSDHSDGEYSFGPLPESVFEAIEDSQESQPADEITESASLVTEIIEMNGGTQDKTCHEGNEPQKAPVVLPKLENKHKKSRTCPICSKVYMASSSYFYHMKYSHNRVKEYECNECGKRFGTKACLAQHANSVHTAEYKFACKHCGKKFRSRASQYIHEQSHGGVKRWACTQCSQSFRWRTHLARHVARHAAARSHACSRCGRAFSVRCDLLRHTRTHAQDAHACPHCALTFAQARYLRVHVHNKHAQASLAPQS